MSSNKVNRINRIQRFRRPEYWPYNTAYAVRDIPPPPPPAPVPDTIYEPFSVPANQRLTITLNKTYYPSYGIYYNNAGVLYINTGAIIQVKEADFPGTSFYEIHNPLLKVAEEISFRLWKERTHKIINQCAVLSAVVYELIPGSDPPRYRYIRRIFELASGNATVDVTPTYTTNPLITYEYHCTNCVEE